MPSCVYGTTSEHADLVLLLHRSCLLLPQPQCGTNHNRVCNHTATPYSDCIPQPVTLAPMHVSFSMYGIASKRADFGLHDLFDSLDFSLFLLSFLSLSFPPSLSSLWASPRVSNRLIHIIKDDVWHFYVTTTDHQLVPAQFTWWRATLVRSSNNKKDTEWQHEYV